MYPSGEETIELDTPPPSPTYIWEDDPSLAGTGDYQVSSPQKRPRAYTARSKKLKKARNDILDAVQCHAVGVELIGTPQEVDEPFIDMAASAWDPPSLHASDQDNGFQEHPHGYQEYVESVTADIAGVYLLNPNLFVVQGWDTRMLIATVSYTCKTRISEDSQRFAHRSFGSTCNARYLAVKRSSSVSVPMAKMVVSTHASCMSTVNSISLQLIHVSIRGSLLLVESTYDDCVFPFLAELTGGADSRLDIVLFARELAEDSSTNLFSVSNGDQQAVKYRCVVYHHGQDSGAGMWRCDRDGDDGCSHVTKARHYLQKLVRQDPSARDPSADSQTAPGMFFCQAKFVSHAKVRCTRQLFAGWWTVG